MAEYTVWVYDQLDYSILPLHGVGNFGALHDRADFPEEFGTFVKYVRQAAGDKPLLQQAGVQATGRVCIGTVQGDLHDIGKNLDKMMMEGKGLEVIDLGTDVSADTFVRTAIEQNCDIICCSALLTTTMGVMGDVVKAAEAAGIRGKVKIMIGGVPVNEAFRAQPRTISAHPLERASAGEVLFIEKIKEKRSWISNN